MILSYGQDYLRAEKAADELAHGSPGSHYYVLERFSPDTPLFDQDARGTLFVVDDEGCDALYDRHGNDVEIQYSAYSEVLT